MKLNLKSIVFMALMIVATSLNAQDYKHEFRIGGGLGIDPHLQNVRNRFVDTNNLEESDFCGINGIQATGFIEYFNHINKYWAIGGNIGISEASGGGARFKREYTNAISYLFELFFLFLTSDFEFHSTSQYLMPAVKYSWIPRNHFCLYSKVALGIMHYKQDITCDELASPQRHENGFRLAYQFSPVGCEFGGERIRGFIELGYGKQGMYNAGVLLNL
jgi:hypothetical protein